MQKQLLIRLVVTALVAWLIAVVVSDDTSSLVWIAIVCWVVLYGLWKWRDGKSTTRPFWWTVLRRIIILVAGAFALLVFMGLAMEFHGQRQAARQVMIEKNRIRVEKNKVRIGMTINEVLPLVHGRVDISAGADGAEFFVLPHGKPFYHYPDEVSLVPHDDGTFTFWCFCATEPVSRNLTESQAAKLVMPKPEQFLPNLTESQATELMKQKMSSDVYGEWHWEYTFVNGTLASSFTVTFGRDGRVNDITDVHVTDLRYHWA